MAGAVPVRVQLRAQAQAGSDGVKALLGTPPRCRVFVAQDGGAASEWRLDDADRAVLDAALPHVHDGTLDDAQEAALAGVLGRAFDGLPFLAGSRDTVVELSAPEHPWLLTDVPWEFARDGSADERLGSRPVLRYTEHVRPDVTVTTRPSVLLAIANVTSLLNAEVAPKLFVPAVPNAIAMTPPYFVAAALGARDDVPVTYATFRATLRATSPNVVVLVAHGSSAETLPAPIVLFDNPDSPERVDVRDLAREIAALPDVWFTVLVCCDLVRGNGGISGGLALVDAGVPEVVAMQGKIPQDEAAKFVRQALVGLFVQHGVGRAVQSGRAAVAQRRFALTPVAFRSRSESGSETHWAKVAHAYSAAVAASAPAALAALPRPLLAPKIRAALELNALVVVDAPYHPAGEAGLAPIVGVVRDMIAGSESAFPARVVVVVDHAAGAADPSGPPQWARTVVQLGAKLGAIAVLLPGGAPPPPPLPDDPDTAAATLLTMIDESGVCLVVNGAGAGDARAVQFWTRIAALAPTELRRGALLVLPAFGAHAVGDALLNANRLVVPRLSAAEIADVLAAELDALGMSAETALELTLGEPYVVQSLKALLAGGALSRAEVEAALRKPTSSVVERIADLTLSAVAADDVPKLVALSYARLPAACDAARSVLLGDAALYPRLVAAAFVTAFERKNVLTGDTETYCWVHPDVGAAARSLAATRFPGALAAAAQRFASEPPDSELKDLARRPGGGEVAFAVQALVRDAALAQGDDGADLGARAYQIGVDMLAANSGVLSNRVLLEMLTVSEHMVSTYAGADPDVLLAIASAANSIDDAARYDAAMAELDALIKDDTAEIPLDLIVRRAALVANVVKDREQVAGAPRALEIVADALAALAPAAAQGDDGLRTSIHEVLYAGAKIELFLLAHDAAGKPEYFERLVAHARPGIERAVALCTGAESEMRRPPERIDWDRVGALARTAEENLQAGDGDESVRAYCYYQIAQYTWKRRKPPPDAEYARVQYAVVEALAKHAGDLAREALALCRRAEIVLKAGPAFDLPAIARRSAELIACLETGSRNSFSQRALERSHRLLARMPAASNDPAVVELARRERARHDRAAVTIDAKLGGCGDLRRLGEAALDYLKTELPQKGSLMAIRTFLIGIAAQLKKRFGIQVNLDLPDCVRDDLDKALARERDGE